MKKSLLYREGRSRKVNHTLKSSFLVALPFAMRNCRQIAQLGSEFRSSYPWAFDASSEERTCTLTNY
jgi:hypothetical protein